MSNSSGRSWWASMGFGQRATAPAQPDFADMGTAFGLDASMDTVIGEPHDKGRPVIEAPSGSNDASRDERRRG